MSIGYLEFRQYCKRLQQSTTKSTRSLDQKLHRFILISSGLQASPWLKKLVQLMWMLLSGVSIFSLQSVLWKFWLNNISSFCYQGRQVHVHPTSVSVSKGNYSLGFIIRSSWIYCVVGIIGNLWNVVRTSMFNVEE